MPLSITRTQAFILGFYRGWFLASVPSTVLLLLALCFNIGLWQLPIFAALGGGFAWWAYNNMVEGIIEDHRKERLKLLYPEE